MQETQARSLVWEDPTGEEAVKPMCHNYWSPYTPEPMLHNKRSHCSEKPVHLEEEQLLLATTRESPHSQHKLIN